MDRTLACPSCAAPLRYAANQGPTIVCSFCGTAVVVPQEWRPPSVGVYVGPPPSTTNTPPIYLALGIAVVCGALAAALAVFMSARRAPRPAPGPRPFPTPLRISTPVPPTDPPGLGTTVLSFGHEGIGPGLFKDARSVAVDGSGNIYVAEYMERRVQVFDPAGKFVTQWMVRPEMAVREMAADRKGNVYIEGSGTIWRFEGSSGKEIGHMDYPGGANFNDVVTTPDGGLIASQFSSRDDIIRFDSSGKTTLVIHKAVSSQSERPELEVHVAVDGLGDIYALSMFSNAVYKFSPDGKFITRFGSEGDEPGQFRAPMAIAVDGQGRVYVSDFKGIQVFDPDGRFLGPIRFHGPALGMAFDDGNALFAAARDHVVKLAIKTQ